jgi:hypothetical protein
LARRLESKPKSLSRLDFGAICQTVYSHSEQFSASSRLEPEEALWAAVLSLLCDHIGIPLYLKVISIEDSYIELCRQRIDSLIKEYAHEEFDWLSIAEANIKAALRKGSGPLTLKFPLN